MNDWHIDNENSVTTLREKMAYLDRRDASLSRKIKTAYYHVAHHIKELRWNIADFLQRGKRGYSDRDLWNLDLYLAGWIPKAIRHYLNHDEGHPAELTAEQWHEILHKIEQAFNDYVSDYAEKESTVEGIQLFAKWFPYLWS